MTNSIYILALGGLFAVTLVGQANAQTIKADHATVDISGLSSGALDAARQLRMNLSHASVGGNIWDGLTKMSAEAKYAMPNWTENDRGNPGWAAKVTEFENWVASHKDSVDVFQNKLCYIDQDANFATYRDSMVALAAKYPGKVFVWWTMPLMTDGGDNALRAAFNKQVREYCKSKDLPLFDIADIESHSASGSPITNAGVEALDPAQSTDGGHLTEAGAARAARAQWALMARIAQQASSTSAGTGGTGSLTTGGPSSTSAGGSSSTTTGDSSGNAGAPASSDGAGASADDSGCAMSAQRVNEPSKWLSLCLVLLAAVARRRRTVPGDAQRPC